MFRIKTDIRQYKCEDQDKVESLIRNWVIRPNDLIYIEDQDSWSPIGEHPEFTTLFSQMNDLDGLEEGSDELLSKALEAATNLLDESAERTLKVVEDKVDDEVTTVHDIQVEEDATPPAAPDGVELYESSPDEITVMTERTMELLDVREEDDELAAREELVATSEFQAQTEGESTSQVDESDHPEREEVLEELLETAEFEREQIVSQFSEPAADEKLDPAEETDDDAQPHVDELRITDELTDEEVESLQKLRAQQREKMALDQHCDEVVASGDDSTASSKPSGDEISEVDDGADDDSLRENESIVELTEMPPPSPTTSYKVGDCISGGYDVPLPFAVEPWKDDVWKVVKAPRASVEKKDLMFPYPQQKHKGEVVVRGFGEEPPSTPAQERSLVVVMMAIALIFVMIVVGVSFF